MRELLLSNGVVLHGERFISGGLLIRDGLIAQIFQEKEKPAGLSHRESIDLQQLYLVPGLVDIHIHGSFGIDCQDTDLSGLSQLSERLLSRGVTSYFPTFVPAPDQNYESAAKTVRMAMQEQAAEAGSGRFKAARIAGIHYEGPFINKSNCGALRPEYFRTFEGGRSELTVFLNQAFEPLKGKRLMTLAPECGSGQDLIRALGNEGVRCFIGHSSADPETLDGAFDAGAHHITHFPNALPPFHHRHPGTVGWTLLRDDVTVDCIADFHHVDRLALKLIHKVKGPARMALISDAIPPAGLGNGAFEVWNSSISVQNGKTSLKKGGAETIAGSVTSLVDAIANVVSLGIPREEATLMASAVPSRVAGIDSYTGSIAVGRPADLIVLDEDFGVRMAIVAGTIASNEIPAER